MSDSHADEPRASLVEDFVDIFYAPTDVFARRRGASPWPTMLIVDGLAIVAAYIMLTLLAPVVDVQISRSVAAMAASGAALSPEALQRYRRFAHVLAIVGAAIGVPISILVLGALSWLVGRLLDAEQTLRNAVLVASLATMPLIVESVLKGVQAFWIDVNAATSLSAVSFSPARFLGPDASFAMLALLERLSPFVIWMYVLLGVGLHVMGRISRGRAAFGAFILWLLGAVPALLSTLGNRG